MSLLRNTHRTTGERETDMVHGTDNGSVAMLMCALLLSLTACGESVSNVTPGSGSPGESLPATGLIGGLVWNEDELGAFLAKPKKYMKGTKMSFAGLKKDKDIEAVIEYLKSFPE